MIESKEQYESGAKFPLREKHKQLFGPPTHKDSDAPAYIPWLEETIEALREVARAAQFAKYMAAASHDTALNEQLDKLRAALDETPDWLTDG